MTRNELMRIILAAALHFSHRVWRWLVAWIDASILAGAAARRDYRYSLRGAFPSLCNCIGCPFAPKNIELEHEHQVAGGVGVGALVLQQLADFAFGIFLRGITPAQQLAHLATLAGLIYVELLIAFMLCRSSSIGLSGNHRSAAAEYG
jgi:hypothetical protein